MYHRNLTQQALAQYKEVQKGNTCTLCSGAQAISNLTGEDVSCKDLIRFAIRHNFSLKYGVLRNPVLGFSTPKMLVRLINASADVYGLDLEARLNNGSFEDLIETIDDPDAVAVITIGFSKNNIPSLYRRDISNETQQIETTISTFRIAIIPWSAHSMFLAAYDEAMQFNGRTTIWGFINSHHEPGPGLEWMTHTDFSNSWSYHIPFNIDPEILS